MNGRDFLGVIVVIICLIIGLLSGDEFSVSVVNFILKAGAVVLVGAILLAIILALIIIRWLTKQRGKKDC